MVILALTYLMVSESEYSFLGSQKTFYFELQLQGPGEQKVSGRVSPKFHVSKHQIHQRGARLSLALHLQSD